MQFLSLFCVYNVQVTHDITDNINKNHFLFLYNAYIHIYCLPFQLLGSPISKKAFLALRLRSKQCLTFLRRRIVRNIERVPVASLNESRYHSGRTPRLTAR